MAVTAAEIARRLRSRAAVALPHAYCAIDRILVRVARQLEGSAPEGAVCHQALLHTAGLAVPRVRPALLSRESVGSRRRLLGFRHFFRHGYAPAGRTPARGLAPRLLGERDRLDALLAKIAAEDAG
jgi:hypothetical protein